MGSSLVNDTCTCTMQHIIHFRRIKNKSNIKNFLVIQSLPMNFQRLSWEKPVPCGGRELAIPTWPLLGQGRLYLSRSTPHS